jgi:hypothetical protein
MSLIRIFTDEDVHGPVAAGLRSAGFDAISTPESARLNEPDHSQLAWAAREGRVLLTFNVADFARLHHDWMAQGQHHAGLVVSQQRPIGDTIRRMTRLGKTLTAEEMRDRLEYLTNW